MSSQQRFQTKLLPGGQGGAWPLIEIPFNVEERFGSRARIAVKGTINDFPFRTSIFPQGNGTHVMMVNRQMRDGAGAKVGDKVNVLMEPDHSPRLVAIPGDLRKALGKNKKAQAAFDKLPPSHKRAYVEAILEAKKPETRKRRIENAVKALIPRSKK